METKTTHTQIMPVVIINDSTGEFVLTRNVTGVKKYLGQRGKGEGSVIKTVSGDEFNSPLEPEEIYKRMGITKTTIGYQNPNEN